MQIEDRRMQAKKIYNIGFINLNLFNEWEMKKNPKQAEANLLQSLLQHQNKQKIIFPYNFEWVLLCIFGFPYLLEVIVM